MSPATLSAPHTRFTLPADRAAGQPPEQRGLSRDQVRLLVADPDEIRHARFRDLGRFLSAGDLLVVNTSGTFAAAVDAVRTGGVPVVVHFAGPARDVAGDWVIELRIPDQSGPIRDGRPDEVLRLPGGAHLTLRAPASPGGRLWRARADLADAGTTPDVLTYLSRYGRPIGYGYLTGRWPLAGYQSVFAREPGSAESPSAGLPFSTELVTALVSSGVSIAPILLHTGVSSLEAGEPPQPERFRVPPATATAVNTVRRSGGRVVAVGTTAVRALETMAGPDGTVSAGSGWTDLVLGPDRPVRTVTGLITGWHEPLASHLLLLEAVAGADLVQRGYDAALRHRYLWHEFGDSCLLLP